MSIVVKELRQPLLVGAILFLASGFFYASAALNFPTLFNLDNNDNFAATSYIAKHSKLPVVSASDDAILFSPFGTTRLLRPPFTYIVAAAFDKLTVSFVDDKLRRQRLGSVLIGALTVVVIFAGLWVAFNHLGLALFGSIAIGLMPKFVMLASCNNDDIGAIFSVSLLFASVLALIRYEGKTWVLISLAFSFGLIFQTKYTAWLVLPWFGLLCLCLLKSVWSTVLKRLPMLLIVFLVSGGWWLMFNMINYGISDPSALRHAVEIQSLLTNEAPNREGYASIGIGSVDLLLNHDQFLTKTFKSLIGYLEWIELEMSPSSYFFYGAILVIGIISGAVRSIGSVKNGSYLEPVILLAILSQCLFYFHHNLVRDIQPQARYLLPIMMPLMYLFLVSLQRLPSSLLVANMAGRMWPFQTVSTVVLTVAAVTVYGANFKGHLKPSYEAQPYFTRIGQVRELDLKTELPIQASSSLEYTYGDNVIELRRTTTDQATLEFAPEFCSQLPVNAVITLDVTSDSSGGAHLRIDHNNKRTFDDVYWRAVPAGRSQLMFAINAKGCSGMQLSLAKHTQKIELNGLRISELRIHRYGKPIYP